MTAELRAAGGVRGSISLLLVLASCVSAPTAVVALWLRSNVLDTETYVQTVLPLASNPEIESLVADRVSESIFASPDLAAAGLGPGAKAAVRRDIVGFLRSDAFRSLWGAINRQAHEALLAVLDRRPSPFLDADGNVVIDLAQVVAQAEQAVSEGQPALAGVAPAPSAEQIVLARRPLVKRARFIVDLVRSLASILPVVSIGFLGAALALSKRRRRSLLVAGAGIAACFGATIAAVGLARTIFLNRVVGADVPRNAASAVFDTVSGNLTTDLLIGTVAGVVLALTAAAAMVGQRVRP